MSSVDKIIGFILGILLLGALFTIDIRSDKIFLQQAFDHSFEIREITTYSVPVDSNLRVIKYRYLICIENICDKVELDRTLPLGAKLTIRP